MKQLGQALRPDELQLLAQVGLLMIELRGTHDGIDAFFHRAMERHYELVALPGFCEALARRDWGAIDRIAERWDF